MKKHVVELKTPEVTDITDNVAGLFTFSYSYLKNATDKVCDAVATGFQQAKADAQDTKDLRVMGRNLRKEVETRYKQELVERFQEMNGDYNA